MFEHKPNIVFIIPDTARYDGVLTVQEKTSSTQALAGLIDEGTSYDQMFSPAS